MDQSLIKEKIDITKKQDVQYAIPEWLRDEQQKLAYSSVTARIQPGELKSDPIAIVCFGPSLNDTWEQIKNFRYIMSCSGAHKFLVERGVIPTWDVTVDPRAHKVKLIGQPHPDVEYLISATCHQAVFDHLKGYKVILWHVFSPEAEALRLLPKGEWAITGGASVGLRCLTIARFFGFTDLHIFGMDGSDSEKYGKHASEHPSQPLGRSPVEYGGKTYYSTPSMAECARQTFYELDQLHDVKATFYGEGLVQAMAKDYVPKPNKNAVVAFQQPELISKEFKQLNEQLHRENLAYGVGGGKHAKIVLKLVESIKSNSVLDYGCQPLNANILTPSGWKTIGELSIGDSVIGKDGKSIKIIDKHSPGVVDIYKVSFSDNTSLIVDGNHLWSVRTSNHQRRNQAFLIKKTIDLIDDLKINEYAWKWRVPLVDKINFNEQHERLIVDPYLFGIIIGDGNISQGCIKICAGNDRIIREVESILETTECKLSLDNVKSGCVNYRIINKKKKNHNVFKNDFIAHGLWGKRAWEKFIPKKYLFSSIENRIALLQGLIDTDGCIGKKIFNISYATTSRLLAEDVKFLCESLGGIGKLSIRENTGYTKNGKKIKCRPCWTVNIKLPSDIVPTRSKKWKKPLKYFANRLITSIEPIGKDLVVGISVDSDDQLYVTEHCLVTHNCGKGYLAKEIPFPIWEYDPAIPGKDESPRPADLVVCSDVLEHIEPEKLDYVLDDLRRCVKVIGYFVIHLGPAMKSYADGRNAHLIQEDQGWWSEQLDKFFSVDKVIEKGNELHVIVSPKKKKDAATKKG